MRCCAALAACLCEAGRGLLLPAPLGPLGAAAAAALTPCPPPPSQLSDLLNWHRKCTQRCTAAVPLGMALAARFDLNRNVPPRCLLTEER